MSEQFNPYQPPSAEVVSVRPIQIREPASRGRRFGTLMVDYCGYLVLSAIVGLVVGIVVGPTASTYFEGPAGTLYGILIYFGYYCFFEGLWARTPGKWIFGTLVTNDAGGRPYFGQIMGRTACRFIPFEPFSFFGESGWHDKFTKTRVVRVSRDS